MPWALIGLLVLPVVAGVRVDSPDNRSATVAALQTGGHVSTTLQPVLSTKAGNAGNTESSTTGNDTLQEVENFLSHAMGNQSTSGLVGVSKNAEGDFETMKTAFYFNLGCSLVAFALFSALRFLFPAVYSKDAEEVAAESDGSPQLALEPPSYRVRSVGDVATALFGWMSIVRAMQDEEIVARCGLDGLQMLELLRLGGRLAILWSTMIICLLCPLHYYLHLHISSGGSLLSMTSMNGLAVDRLGHQHYLLLIWMHTATVWFVVLAASHEIYNAQCRFLERRFEWLKQIPEPRATTLLVENLPQECRSDFALHQYFARLFSDAISRAYIVRRTDRLRRVFVEMERAAYDLHCAQNAQSSQGRTARQSLQSALCCHRRNAVGFYTRELEALREAVVKERKAVEEGVMAMDPEVCSCAGFVTFTSRRMCMLARSPQYRADSRQITVTMPPDPQDVRFQDLAKDPKVQASGNITAAGLLLLIFVVWAPLIATFMDKVEPVLLSFFKESPGIQHLVQGVLSTGALKMFMSFLPTMLMAIISNVLTLKAGTWAQLKLQDWYFSFQVVFVLLVTAIIGTILDVLAKVLAHPGEVIYLLADALPGFSNFYINYLMLGCLVHVFDLLRVAPLAKYLFARARGGDASDARRVSEPEDQDSDGMGARMAKITLHLVVACVFGSCCPVILVFAWLYCSIGGLIYGYLLIYAETKKPDMGGSFWVKSLRHVFAGLAIYVLLMVGLISQASSTREAPLVAGLALAALALGYFRFAALSWETLPFEAIVEVDLADRERGKHHGDYTQAECQKLPFERDRSEKPVSQRFSQSQPSFRREKRGDGTD